MLETIVLVARALALACRGYHELVLENFALRQQLHALKRTVRRPQLRTRDRLLWILLIEAAERAGEDAEGRDIRGTANALREFGDLARWVLAVHGLFVPNNNEVCMIVDRVARQHLDLEDARRELKEALSVVVEVAQRDPIESAHNHVRAASEEAYFYAGLAFGLTFAEFKALSAP